jgi:ketosteroid isomerase-like protein
MSLDPMAAVLDWLDAYRSGDLETLMGLYVDDATIECGCGSTTVLTGREALRSYWIQRLRHYQASELDDLEPLRDGAAITYRCHGQSVRGSFEFNAAGRITFQRCGPSN